MYQIVLCTCPSMDIAKQLATHLVTEKLAACVNIMPQVTSIYQWQGEIQQDSEFQLIIKTTANNFNALSDAISQLHPYDVPEIIAVDIVNGNQPYLNWISESLK